MGLHAVVFACVVALAAAIAGSGADTQQAGGQDLDFHVISFAVGQPRYFEALDRLRQSCDALGVKYARVATISNDFLSHLND